MIGASLAIACMCFVPDKLRNKADALRQQQHDLLIKFCT
jgi:hypothetical protein